MKRRFLLPIAALVCSATSVFAQGLPPLQPQQAPAGLPPLGEPGKASTELPPMSLSVEAMNNDLKAARAANQEKRFADAEALMLKDTAAKPNQVYLWIELGLAQLGQKKYAEAEVSFKKVLSSGPGPATHTQAAAFYSADGAGTRSGGGVGTPDDPQKAKRNPEVEGIAQSSLGEIYIRTKRNPEAVAAFDEAAKANPAQAALYYGNETVFFFQANDAPDQLVAANKAVAVDPTRAKLYYFKAQALTTQAAVDLKTNKLILPAGCLEAYQKYLELEPNGQFAADAKSIITAAGQSFKAVFKK